jgi:iron complex outermembrane receptor protein
MRRLLFSGALVAALSLEGLAAAQPPPAPAPPDPVAPAPATPAPDPFRLEETVEVTGTRGTIESARSPVSSVVVTRAEIESRNIRTVEQAVNAVEGVAAYRTRGVADNGAGIGMRGFSGRSSGQSRVLVLLDGQPMNDSYLGAVDWATVPVDEVERVEVVRGPFSALYGGNAMGGVVNILTRPVSRRSVEVFGQAGTYGTESYSGRASDRWFGRLGLTLAYAHLGTDGYRAQVVTRTATASTPTAAPQVTGLERVSTGTGGTAYVVGFRGENWYRQHAVRARTEYVFSPAAVVTAQFIRQSKTTGWGRPLSTVRDASGQPVESGPSGLVFLDGDVWRRFTLQPSQFLGARQGGGSNTYQAQWLQSFSTKGQVRVQAGFTDTPGLWTTLPGASATVNGGPGTRTGQDFRGLFATVQWSRAAGAHDVTVGADHRRDEATVAERPTADYLSTTALPTLNTFSRGQTRLEGVYLQDRITFGDRATVIVGGRYDHWRTEEGQTQLAPNTLPRSVDPRSAQALTGKVSALVRPLATMSVRASVGTAFRNPSVFEMYRDLLDAGILLLGNPGLRPERLLAGELGIRQSIGRWMTTDVAVYRNRISNLIYRSTDLTGDPTGLTRRMTNAGEGQTTGVEVGVTLTPASWLRARPTYTFTDATITRNNAIPATVGKAIPFVPRHAAGLTLMASRRWWSVTSTTRYQTDVFSTDTNADVVSGVPGAYESFVETDLAMSVTPVSRVTVLLTADNVLNRRYFMFFRNPGRMLHAGLRVRF